MLNPEALEWNKGGGLIPAIVQDAIDGRVLMVAFMNLPALTKTIESGLVTFWSRSRNSLWTKGEMSGHRLELVDIRADCDSDALLVFALPTGPACHLGTDTCFDGANPATPQLAFLGRLERLIESRDRDRPQGSYTSELLASGVRRIAQKVGEEAVETALAASGEDDELLDEAADLIYHLLVLLRARDLTLGAVVARLESRHAD